MKTSTYNTNALMITAMFTCTLLVATRKSQAYRAGWFIAWCTHYIYVIWGMLQCNPFHNCVCISMFTVFALIKLYMHGILITSHIHAIMYCFMLLSVREITKSNSTFSVTNISSNITCFLQLHDTIKIKSNHTRINYNHNNIAIRNHIMIYNSV